MGTKVVFAHVGYAFKSNFRYIGFVIPTLILPTLFYLLFGSSESTGIDVMPASFAAFAIFGVVFFQFGVAGSVDRESKWMVFQRSLPLSAVTIFTARVITALLTAIIASSLVLLSAIILNGYSLPARTWVNLLISLYIGALPFAFAGAALGYWVHPKSALPIANLLYLLLSAGGGLWIAPQNMPAWLKGVSEFLPTWHWAQIIWSSIFELEYPVKNIIFLTVFGIISLILAIKGYNRFQFHRLR